MNKENHIEGNTKTGDKTMKHKVEYQQDMTDQVTQAMIDNCPDAVMTNDARATNGVAMSMTIPVTVEDDEEYDLVIKFDLAGREQDDEEVYTVDNVIAAYLQ